MRTLEMWELSQLQEGDTVSLYYPDSKSGKPCPRKGKVLSVGSDRITLDTSRGPRTLIAARMQGTIKVLS